MRKLMLTRLWFPLGELFFGLWLFDCLPLKAPSWLTEGPMDDPIIAFPDVARAVFLSLLILISLGPFIWIDTARLRRRMPLRELLPMLKLILSSRRGAMTFIVIALFLGQTAWFVVVRGVPLDSFFVRINLAIVCGVLMIILLPPTAIVLASSSAASGELLEMVSRSFFPFRVVALLDGARLGPAIFANKNDNLRTIGGNTWRQAVHHLVEITPFVIVDARSSTPPVCEEIRYMLHHARVTKAIFVVNDDGRAPGLEAVEVDLRQLPHIRCPIADMPREIARFKITGAMSLQ